MLNILLGLLFMFVGCILGVTAVCILLISRKNIYFKIITVVSVITVVMLLINGYIQIWGVALITISYLIGIFVMAILNGSPKSTDY